MQISYSTNNDDFVKMVRAVKWHKPAARRREWLCYYGLSLAMFLFWHYYGDWPAWRAFVFSFAYMALLFVLSYKKQIRTFVKKRMQQHCVCLGNFTMELSDELLTVRSKMQDTRYELKKIEYILEAGDYCFILFDSSKFRGIPINRNSVKAGDFGAFVEALKNRWQEEPWSAARIKKFKSLI